MQYLLSCVLTVGSGVACIYAIYVSDNYLKLMTLADCKTSAIAFFVAILALACWGLYCLIGYRVTMYEQALLCMCGLALWVSTKSGTQLPERVMIKKTQFRDGDKFDDWESLLSRRKQ
jgi:hypothetical protein